MIMIFIPVRWTDTFHWTIQSFKKQMACQVSLPCTFPSGKFKYSRGNFKIDCGYRQTDPGGEYIIHNTEYRIQNVEWKMDLQSDEAKWTNISK